VTSDVKPYSESRSDNFVFNVSWEDRCLAAVAAEPAPEAGPHFVSELSWKKTAVELRTDRIGQAHSSLRVERLFLMFGALSFPYPVAGEYRALAIDVKPSFGRIKGRRQRFAQRCRRMEWANCACSAVTGDQTVGFGDSRPRSCATLCNSDCVDNGENVDRM
jgi:hypothetical protein